MSEVFQCRIESGLMNEAKAVAEEIGTTPGEVVRLMFKQMIKRRAIPFPLQAISPEDEIFSNTTRRNRLADEF